MVRLSRLLKDYGETGSLNSLLALWGFVDETTFLTKTGALGVVLRLEGCDDDCFDHRERREVVERFAQALRLLDERFRIYQYLVKRHAEPVASLAHAHPIINEALQRRVDQFRARADRLFVTELYVVILFERGQYAPTVASRLQQLATAPVDAIQEWFSTCSVVRLLDEQLTRAHAELHHRTTGVMVHLRDTLRPRLLAKAEAFTFFRHLLHYDPVKAEAIRLKYDTHVDFFVADAAVECHRDHLRVDDHRVAVLTMKEPPARTFAHVLADLHLIDAPLIVCLEWQRAADGAMRRHLHARRRHFFNRRVSMVNYVSPDTRPEEMLVDDSATAIVAEMGQCLTEMEVHGHVFGACSLTIVVADRDGDRLQRTTAACTKVFARHDGALMEERYNLLNAWLAVVPGNAAHNLRRVFLLNTHVADLSFLFRSDTGMRTSTHLGGREYLAAFETEHHTPYFWNLHVGDVGHALILGATGSGKSFLLNFILTHAQKYDPITVIFDLGRGYERLTTRLGGSVWRMGLSHAEFTINPFCLDPTLENRHFLSSFVRVLVGQGAGAALTAREEVEIDEAVENLYTLDPAQRRLCTLRNLLSRELAERLHRWVHGGPYAQVFDHTDDTLTFQRLQCFDFQGLERYPQVLEPLLFYVLHRASAAVREGALAALKLFVLDEAWRFAADPIVRAYIREALKTWRKQNAAMLLATQSADDFASADLLRTIVESCPTTFFLANPAIDREAARQLFGLNETQADRIATLRPRQQVLLKRPDIAKVLNLDVDAQSYWLYTNTPPDTERLHAIAAQHGAQAAVNLLAAG
jgi:type IV secretion system protein TrbE